MMVWCGCVGGLVRVCGLFDWFCSTLCCFKWLADMVVVLGWVWFVRLVDC